MRSKRTLVLTAIFSGAVASLAAAAPAWALRVLPQDPASPNADDERTAYIVGFVIFAIAAVAINGAILAAIRGRRAEGEGTPTRAGHGVATKLAGVLALVAAAIFTFTVVVSEDVRDAEAASGKAEPIEIFASGQQWLWRYRYPNGTASYYELVVPVDTPIHLEVDSVDVRHRWWVPSLGGAVDAVPGHVNDHWFIADRTGVFKGASTRFSGPAFATMRTRVRVVESDEYEAWLKAQTDGVAKARGAVNEAVLEQSGQAGGSE